MSIYEELTLFSIFLFYDIKKIIKRAETVHQIGWLVMRAETIDFGSFRFTVVLWCDFGRSMRAPCLVTTLFLSICLSISLTCCQMRSFNQSF